MINAGFFRIEHYKIYKYMYLFLIFYSCGGNVLINIGPTHDGRIAPVFEERLKEMGQWLGVNGEAIYESIPWSHQNDTTTPDVW